MHKDDVPSPLPIFTNHDVGENYRAGLYQSRAEAELDDILKSCFANEPSSEQKSERTPLTPDAVANMTCVAIIHNGNIIPVMSITEIDPPRTAAQRMALCTLAARAIIDALLEVFTRWYNREDGNDDESGVPA